MVQSMATLLTTCVLVAVNGDPAVKGDPADYVCPGCSDKRCEYACGEQCYNNQHSNCFGAPCYIWLCEKRSSIANATVGSTTTTTTPAVGAVNGDPAVKGDPADYTCPGCGGKSCEYACGEQCYNDQQSICFGAPCYQWRCEKRSSIANATVDSTTTTTTNCHRHSGCHGAVNGDPTSKNIVELAESVAILSNLVAAVVAGDLVDTLASPGPFTVFAPTNDAFGALPAGTVDSLMKPANKAELVDILTNHVLPEQILYNDLSPEFMGNWKAVGGGYLILTRHGAELGVQTQDRIYVGKVTTADNLASNGVVHIIDGVLLPRSDVVV